jgi:hypothetical protein
MTNPVQLVAVATVYYVKLHLFIYIYMYTVTIKKST